MKKNKLIIKGDNDAEFRVVNGVYEVLFHAPYYEGYFLDEDIGKEVEVYFKRYFDEPDELYSTPMKVVSIERAPTTQYILLRESSRNDCNSLRNDA